VWDLELSGVGKMQEGASAAAVCVKATATFDLHSFCKCVLVGNDGNAGGGEEGGSGLVALAHGSCDVSLVMFHL
jgi:hypothetical protein